MNDLNKLRLESTLQMHLSNSRYANVDGTKRDALVLLQMYPSLRPKCELFVFNDGSQRNLVCLHGTLPVPYMGSQYNIPVAIWIMNDHPDTAPWCYVIPTSEMNVQVSESVQSDGKITLPYLREWQASNSDLLSLVQLLIISFGVQPPVFAKPPSGTSDIRPGSTITSQHLRDSLETAVEEKIKRALSEEFSTKNVEIQSLRNVYESLNENRGKIVQTSHKMHHTRDLLEAVCIEARRDIANVIDADFQVQDRDQDVNKKVDQRYVAATPLHRQIAECYAQEQALSDAIYWLGEALRKGKLDCETYLKNVRDLSRKQFYLHATIQAARTKARLD